MVEFALKFLRHASITKKFFLDFGNSLEYFFFLSPSKEATFQVESETCHEYVFPKKQESGETRCQLSRIGK